MYNNEITTPHEKKAIELFEEGYNCAQAVFLAFSDLTGYSKEDALRISSSFGGGMGGMREVCGSVSGMFMVCGVLYGYGSVDNIEEKKSALCKNTKISRGI